MGSESYTISGGYGSDVGIDGEWTTVTGDPYISFNNLGHISGITGVYIELERAIDEDILIQTFYATSTTGYSEDYSVRKTLVNGQTKLIIPFDDSGNWTKVRYDIGQASNLTYKIKSLGVIADANQWNNNDIILSLDTTESGSGVNYWQYTYSSSASTTGTNNTSTWVSSSNSNSTSYITTPFVAERNQPVYVRACDVAGNCSSTSSTYIKIDKTTPTGSVSTSISSSTVTAKLTASDSGSGVKASYGWKISTSSTCNSSTTGFTTSTNSTYNFAMSSSGTYYVCVKVTDNAGNIAYIKSGAVNSGITYALISSNYSCSNKSVGSNPVFTYTGNCEIEKVDTINWKIRFLSTGNLKFNADVYVEAFLVGAGGSGKCAVMGSYDTWGCASGGGGYHSVIEHSIVNGTSYTITVGEANGGSTIAFDTEVKGGGNGSVTGSDHYSGSGGEACYEFEESTGDTLYSGVHSVALETPPANTGRGGMSSLGNYATYSGSSGIVIIRNKASDVTISYNNNGGSGCGSKYVMTGYAYGELCTPTRDGYSFLGWYTSSNYTTEVKSTDIVTATENITLYAYWTKKMEYSCANSSYGSNPAFTYTGNCEVLQYEDPDDWRVKLLSSGDLTFSSSVDIDAFLVGAGGSGKCDIMSNYATSRCSDGGGGYHTVIEKSIVKGTTYAITVGVANGGATVAFGTTVNGGTNGWVSSSDAGNGTGGTACYEFEESTGDILYSGVHPTAHETPPANTGRGGNHADSWTGTVSGSSGIVIIRNKR